MIKLLDILREAKQVGPLYHFTNISSLNDIIKTGIKFKPDNSTLPQYKNTFFISTTRQQSGAGAIEYLSNLRDFDIRIKLDGDRISEKYRVEPINVENIWMADDEDFEKSAKFPELYEERIISKRPGYLSPEYILQIDTTFPEDEAEDEISGEILSKINFVDQF
jgi:hypothetical protein